MKQPSGLILPKLALLLLLATLTLSCEEGCIRCASNASGSFACEICDLYSSFYKNKDGVCEQRKIADCLIPSSDQNQYLCAQCKQGMILDTAALKCVAIPDTKVIPNCRQYSLVGTCSQCYQHYYLKDAVCTRAKVIIEQCRIYFNDDLCLQCDDNYNFDVKAGECIKFEPKENCGKHSFGSCAMCNYGFFLNQNPSLNGTVTSASAQEFARDLWEGVNFTEFPLSRCLPIVQPFCLAMGNSLGSNMSVPNCAKCNDTHYLQSNYECITNPLWEVKNCLVYSNFNTCTKCNDGYYLHRNECKTRSEHPNCEIVNDKANNCWKCVENFYTDAGLCKARTHTTIDNCMTLSRIADECDTCNANFKLTEDWIACYSDIKNCQTYDYGTMKASLKFTCAVCDSNHFLELDFTYCRKQDIPHCDSYVTLSNKCQGCDLGYYLSSALNLCPAVTLTNCTTQDKDKNECTQCNNLYWLDTTDKTCHKIADVNCTTNVTNQKNCQVCKGSFYLKANATTSVVECTKSNTVHDVEFCLSSTSTNEDDICSSCPYGIVPMVLGFRIKEKLAFCKTMSAADLCTECEENTDVTYHSSGSNYDCVPTTNPTSNCIQIQSANTAVLGDNDGICAKCRNSLTHYLLGNHCWNRSSVLQTQCSALNGTKDDCVTCNEGFIAKPITTVTSLKCVANLVNFVPRSNCVIHNSIDPSKCVTCDWGYTLNSRFECVDTGKFIPKVYTAFNPADGSFDAVIPKTDTMSGSCAVFDKSGACRKCASGYIPVVTEFTNSNDSVNYGLSYSHAKIVVCLTSSLLVKKKLNNVYVGYVNDGECAEAIRTVAQTKTNYSCVRCVNGANAKFLKANYSNDTLVDITASSIPTVENCLTAGTQILSKKYETLFLRRALSNADVTIFSSWIYYDTCPNSSEKLIVIVNDSSSSKIDRAIPGDGTTAETRYRCHNFLSGGVENCWVYAANSSSTSGFDYATTAQCVACRPGYYATIKTSTEEKYIQTCTQITDCDLSNIEKNRWLNACETCGTNKYHPWKTDGPSSQHYIDTSTCLARTKDNCVNESSANTCFHCGLGFKLNAAKDSCEAVTPAVDHCKIISYRKESINFASANNFAPLYNLTISLFEQRYNDKALVGDCKTCNDEFSNYNISSDMTNLSCKTVVGVLAADLIANCKLYKGNTVKRCATCEPGYLISDSAESCVDNQLNQYPHCSIVKQGQAECQLCEGGALLNTTTKLCVKLQNCTTVVLSSDRYICSLCNDRYMVDDRDNSLCVPTSVPNCLKMNAFFCIECEAGYKASLNTASPNYITCTKSLYSDPYYGYFGKFIIYGSPFTFNQPPSIDSNRYYSTSTPTTKHHKQLCYQKQMPLCLTYASNHMNCTTCQDRNYLHKDTNTCTPNSIPNCQVQANQYECTTCDHSYFLNSLKQCSKHQVLHCTTYVGTSDTCSACNEGYWLKSPENTCHLRLETNCSLFEQNEDACSKCTSDYYLTNKKCVAYTLSGCKTYSDTADECVDCPERYWKNSEKRCIYNSQDHCLTYSITENKCNVCKVGTDNTTNVGNYKADSNGVCQTFVYIHGCIQYDFDGSGTSSCEKCKENYILKNNECHLFPNGTRNCLKYNSPTDCIECICDHFKDENSECTKVDTPIPNCQHYESATLCKQCASNHLMSEDKKTCTVQTESSCLTWETLDSCATCSGATALYEGTQLKADNVTKVKKCMNKIVNCTKHGEVTFEDPPSTTPIVYTCQECSFGYLPATDTLSCEPTEYIPGCLKMESVTLCNTCQPNHVLSLDKKTCSTDYKLSGANCAIGTVSDKINCNACKEGYLVGSEGTCVKCGGDGCSVCSKDNISQCDLCAGGYFMTNAKACTKNAGNDFQLVKESIEGGDPINVVNQ